MKQIFRIALLSLFLLAASAGAKDKTTEPVVTAHDATAFAQQADAVRAQLGKGGRYEYVREDERGTLDRRLSEMQQLLAAHGPVQSMNDAQRVQLFNAQEQVNAILTLRDSKRLICTRRPPTGSHVAENRCVTYGEQERIRDATQRHMLDLERQGAPSPVMETRANMGGG